MLTTDLVRVRRRGARLEVPALHPGDRERLLTTAEQLLEQVREHGNGTLGELEARFQQIEHDPTDYKRARGLIKLLLDRCRFEPRSASDPVALRRTLFGRAAERRRSLGPGEPFAAGDVIAEVGGESDLAPDDLSEALFSDLKRNHRLVGFDSIGAATLVEAYELAQHQAVLLRAVSVTVTLRGWDPASYRQIFRQIKFRRLLHRIERLVAPDTGYRIEIDGPFSLFQSVTRYGLQLALLLPALREHGAFALEARVRWERGGELLRFELQGGARAGGGAVPLPPPPDEVARLVRSFERLRSAWTAAPADALLELPGVGLCVPDLVFTHAGTGRRVYLEVLGYWSRAAVWRRVELVEAGLGEPIVFAVSERLRVSEQALSGDLPGQLYVYKGTLSAAELARRLDACGERAPSGPAHG